MLISLSRGPATGPDGFGACYKQVDDVTLFCRVVRPGIIAGGEVVNQHRAARLQERMNSPLQIHASACADSAARPRAASHAPARPQPGA
jgi:hypothetical protein